MMVLRVGLERYEWMLTLVFFPRACEAVDVGEMLRDAGCGACNVARAVRLIGSGRRDTGLTYSNARTGATIMVIGMASDVGELLNTLGHEKNHMEMHIAEAYGIDPYGEEASYLSGDITEYMYRGVVRALHDAAMRLLPE